MHCHLVRCQDLLRDTQHEYDIDLPTGVFNNERSMRDALKKETPDVDVAFKVLEHGDKAPWSLSESNGMSCAQDIHTE